MEFLIAISLRSLALAAAAWCALALLRVKSPSARHAVWTLVTAGMLAIALAAATLPTVPIRVLRPVSTPPAVLVAPIVPGNVPATAPTTPRPFPWMLIYAAGLLLSVGRLAYGYYLTRRLVRDATRILYLDDAVYESAQISVPLTIAGIILLPAEWHTWNPEKLDAVLVHERTHIGRADWAISALAAVNRCVFWFHPLAWWIEAHLRTLAEEACDDASLAHVARESYAQVLIDMAAAVRGTKHRVAWEAMAMAKGAEVRMRIERILDDTRPLSAPITRARWAAMASVAVPVIFFAAVARPAHVRAQQRPQASPPAIAQQQPDDTELRRARTTLESVEAQIATFKRDNMGKLPEQFQINVSQLNNYQMAMANANDAIGRLQQQKLQLETQLTNFTNQLAYFQSMVGGDSNKVQALTQRMVDVQSQIAALQEMYTESAPPVKAARAKLSAIEREREDEMAHMPAWKMVKDLEGSIALVNTQVQTVNMSMDEQLKRIAALNSVIAQYQMRVDMTPQLEAQYAQLVRKYQEAQKQVERLSVTPAGPRLISRRDPEYTPEARQAGLQGKVELSVTVGTDGVPRDIQVLHGLGSGLDQKAIDCASTWRFQPATLNGNTVTAVILVEVPFRLP
jgi:TonB family protein